MVEPIRIPTPDERRRALENAGHNLFRVASTDVAVDLLTDSGTTAMSDTQWAALMRGDEAYAGSRSFARFEQRIRATFGLEHVIPVHQGRAAEHLLVKALGRPGMCVPNNAHFDTTRANVEIAGLEACDCPLPEALVPSSEAPFKGNMNLIALTEKIRLHGRDRIPFVLLTVTNNSMGGQPVSLENIKAVARIAKAHGIPLFLDAARFAENAMFIRMREPGQTDRSLADIVRDMMDATDGAYMSCKKDGLVNTGGWIAVRDGRLAARLRELLILLEGFPTYGGLARRDLEAITVGLQEVLEPEYLRFRLEQTAYLHDALRRAGVPLVCPPGGHAVYVDAATALPHLRRDQYPAQALANEIYLEGAVRTCGFGRLALGTSMPLELVRLAIPRRVYTQAHLDYAADTVAAVVRRADRVRPLRLVEGNGPLAHFTARLEPLNTAS